MNTGAILIGLALALLTGAFLVDPYLRRNNSSEATVRSPEEDPNEVKSDALIALRDLDFDFQTGKLIEPDYLIARTELMQDAVRVFDAMDRREALLDEQIEKEVSSLRRSKLDFQVCNNCGSQLLVEDRYCTHCGKEIDQTCPACGNIMKAEDLFMLQLWCRGNQS